jgi:hypothetical protein
VYPLPVVNQSHRGRHTCGLFIVDNCRKASSETAKTFWERSNDRLNWKLKAAATADNLRVPECYSWHVSIHQRI